MMKRWFVWVLGCLLLSLLTTGCNGCGGESTLTFSDCKTDEDCAQRLVCRINEQSVAKCVREDNDDDGFAPKKDKDGNLLKQSDCDDNNANVFPGAPELCDNKVDDNCNGTIDEQPCDCIDGTERECGPPKVGECRPGRQICKNGRYGECVGAIDAKTETCNGKDDDCDGSVDEDVTQECYTGKDGTKNKGPCKAGTQTCENGQPGECKGEITPADKEACNGEDDDCDGIIDNDLVEDCYSGPDGTKDMGECKGGKRVCLAGTWGQCQGAKVPVPEDCNGKDDDCNGKIDDGLASEKCYNGPASTKGVGACREGVRNCDGGKWTTCTGEVTPAAQETCNDKVDNNCDGNVDEGCSQALFEITKSIDTDSGKIDGILSPGWQGSGKFQLQEMKIPKNARVVVTGKNPLTLTIQGPVIIEGILDVAGKDGQSTNCQTSNAGQGGQGAGGGGGTGGAGGACNIQGSQPSAGDGTGLGGGKGGNGSTQSGSNGLGGAGGGGGHANKGNDGLPSGNGGKAGLPVGSTTTISPGSGGGGGACGAYGSSFLGVYTPGAGGGGGGGALQIDSTATMTISGSILANGGDGGDAPSCGGGVVPGNAIGGGGGGGAGGAILLSAKTLVITNSAFITAAGGVGKGQTATKGGDASEGRIRFLDATGQVNYPAARVNPTPTVAKR